jgi:hypothetical protein
MSAEDDVRAAILQFVGTIRTSKTADGEAVNNLPQALKDKIQATVPSEIRDLLLTFGDLCYVAGKLDGTTQYQEGLSKCFESHFPKGR